MHNQRLNNLQILPVTVTPVLDTSAYISGDVLAVPVLVPLIGTQDNHHSIRAEIVDVTIIDIGCKKGALDLVFFTTAPTTFGAANAAVGLSSADAQLIRKIVSIAGTDYTELKASTNAIAWKDFPPFTMLTPSGAQGFYLGVISRDTKTYGASDLQITLGVRLHNVSLC